MIPKRYSRSKDDFQEIRGANQNRNLCHVNLANWSDRKKHNRMLLYTLRKGSLLSPGGQENNKLLFRLHVKLDICF